MHDGVDGIVVICDNLGCGHEFQRIPIAGIFFQLRTEHSLLAGQDEHDVRDLQRAAAQPSSSCSGWSLPNTSIRIFFMILQSKLFGKIFFAGADAHRVHGDPGILQPVEPQRDADGNGRREEAGIQRRKGEQAAEAEQQGEQRMAIQLSMPKRRASIAICSFSRASRIT